MQRFDYDFPMNAVMVGSYVPGIRMHVEVRKITNYPDGTNHKLIKSRETRPDVLAEPGSAPRGDNWKQTYPQMHGPHTKDHGFMGALKQLMGGHKGPQAKEGYELATENRDWRYT